MRRRLAVLIPAILAVVVGVAFMALPAPATAFTPQTTITCAVGGTSTSDSGAHASLSSLVVAANDLSHLAKARVDLSGHTSEIKEQPFLFIDGVNVRALNMIVLHQGYDDMISVPLSHPASATTATNYLWRVGGAAQTLGTGTFTIPPVCGLATTTTTKAPTTTTTLPTTTSTAPTTSTTKSVPCTDTTVMGDIHVMDDKTVAHIHLESHATVICKLKDQLFRWKGNTQFPQDPGPFQDITLPPGEMVVTVTIPPCAIWQLDVWLGNGKVVVPPILTGPIFGPAHVKVADVPKIDRTDVCTPSTTKPTPTTLPTTSTTTPTPTTTPTTSPPTTPTTVPTTTPTTPTGNDADFCLEYPNGRCPQPPVAVKATPQFTG
jgi:hypothetical protein